MKEILLLRAKSEEYTRTFNAAGYQPSFIEPLSFTFTNEHRLRDCLSDATYDGLVLTSPRAITAVSRQWDPNTVPMCFALVYVVGIASAQEAEELLGVKAKGTEAGNSQALAQIIIQETASSKKKFLFPCGNLASDNMVQSLQKAGLEVDTLPVYNTIENSELSTLLSTTKTPSALVFFSPSGCKFVYKHLQNSNKQLASLPQFAIGPTTARSLEQQGVKVARIANTPCPLDLIACLDLYFNMD
ncbi:Uroporphyrinogen-III synthase [Eumeta japonica]|uniref:Uroporphyrinogen-III synthase n=1 Tax=Eumeta variegata TaxID=151549 RepID=A0A4C1ZQS3_EUMVA|nr:Uroporphyrinogen-III synthase [Eumeta japonica]